MIKFVLFLFLALGGGYIFSFFSKKQRPSLETVDKVDLDKYMGKWYEIAHLPQRFQRGCNCTTAEYELKKDYVQVTNTCVKNNGKISRITGKAFPVPNSNNAKLKVQFFWPFKGDYWVLNLAQDYSYAVVGNDSRKDLWILSRKPEMDPALYNKLVNQVKEKGFDVSNLIVTGGNCK